jgi:S-adenosylmethionine synthetase
MYLFTSEYVSAGHPDKCADIIADSIVDAYIMADKNSRVASEVFVAGKNIIIGGEVQSKLKLEFDDYDRIVKNALNKIGYKNNKYFTKEESLQASDIKLQVLLNQQSPDINQGVDKADGEIGAGDQGIMFGYASSETKEYMPAAIMYAKQIANSIYKFALQNPDKLGVDIKTQVTIDYGEKINFINCKPKKIHTIVASAPCVSSMNIDDVRDLIRDLIKKSNLPNNLFDEKNTIIHINPTGKYVSHSPLHDSGLTGRKLIVDTFGGYSPIGGGAQSSKDYTKVDRSALYAARWIAKHIVAAKLARQATVQISYAIGIAKPTSVSVDTSGTNSDGIDDTMLSNKVLEKFPLTPSWIRDTFKLDEPSENTFTYANVAFNGQVGVDSYPWEQLTELEWFKSIAR